jgi:hypothetical protein
MLHVALEMWVNMFPFMVVYSLGYVTVVKLFLKPLCVSSTSLPGVNCGK